MTWTSQFTTVATSIASIAITGVSVKDIGDIPEHMDLQGPVLMPDPSRFLSDLQFERVSFGPAGSAKADLRYRLHYVLLYQPVASGISELDAYAALISLLATVLDAISNTDAISGAEDVTIGNVSGVGVVQDPSLNQYWGALIELNVLENYEA